MERFPVEPIRSLEDIERIREILHDSPRDLLLFDLATQTGASLTHLLQLRVKDLRGLEVGGRFLGPIRYSSLSERVKQSFDHYVETTRPPDNAYLFRSRKGSKPLQISSVSHLVRRWFEAAGLTGLSAFRSLHETWRLHYRGRNQLGTDRERPEGQRDVYVLQSVNKLSLQETIYLRLFEAIVAGRVAPGERLSIETLSDHLKVSHMPVRDALSRLEVGGFVAKEKMRGYVVNQLSQDDLAEITRIRLLLEGLAAKTASLQRAEEILDHLRTASSDYQDALTSNDVETTLRINKDFHFTVYRAANMPILLDTIENLWNRVSPYLHIYLQVSDHPQGSAEIRESITNHERVLRGMICQDPKKAAEGIRSDIKAASRVVSRLLRRGG